jgi:Right handed beta helix region
MALLLMATATLPLWAAETYYLDCSAGSDHAAGTSPEAAWKTPAHVSATTFSRGDTILLRRGVRCDGALWPKGSGEVGQPIRVGAYGSGPLPLIQAADTDQAAFKLFDQQFWEVENLEIVGGNPHGVLVSGSKGHLKYFRLRNLLIHDVAGIVKEKTSGLLTVVAPPELVLEDIVIDGVTAYGTTQWGAIVVSGGSKESRIRGVTVRNSVVHDVFGDGIVLFQVEDGLIEKSAAWLTGLQPSETLGTPNGIWTWRCRNCIVQWTEGFFIDSPGVDGGVYDIDFGNDDNTVQYNYGHDTQGYCVALFAADKEVTSNSIIRYNVCVNNGRSPKLAFRQGDLYILTWSGGTLDGVLICNNTFYWNPSIDAPAVQATPIDFTGSRPNLVANNIFFSRVPSMINTSPGLNFRSNIFWYDGRDPARWVHDNGKLTQTKPPAEDIFADPALDDLLQPTAGSPAINHALEIEPPVELDAMLARIPRDGKRDVGAIEFKGSLPPPTSAPDVKLADNSGDPISLKNRNNKWLLLVVGKPDAAARGQLVFVQTALAQYGRRELEAALALDGGSADLRHDWHLGDVQFVRAADVLRQRLRLAQRLATLLISPDGAVVRRWQGFVSPAELGLTLRHYLGAAPGSPGLMIPAKTR